MEAKTCPDCSERVRATAPKCRFCAFRFDAPKASSLPRLVLVLGVALAIAGVVSTIALVVSTIVIALGVCTMFVQKSRRRARRFSATGNYVRLAPVAIFTTLRGH